MEKLVKVIKVPKLTNHRGLKAVQISQLKKLQVKGTVVQKIIRFNVILFLKN